MSRALPHLACGCHERVTHAAEPGCVCSANQSNGYVESGGNTNAVKNAGSLLQIVEISVIQGNRHGPTRKSLLSAEAEQNFVKIYGLEVASNQFHLPGKDLG